jgi:hypothetical protein
LFFSYSSSQYLDAIVLSLERPSNVPPSGALCRICMITFSRAKKSSRCALVMQC